ncbi:MAG: LysR family transcriptional regulator, partial [Clostridia bacterium]|nr:LysR family transcriptional regulator [Clostridia bacterium]
MTIMQLRYMIAISETGSLSRASEVLFVSQPSLTSSVKELERELGINIFNRGGKGMTLTADGAEFILYARQVCQMFDNLLDKYEKPGTLKKKFGVSAQHYSFAVKAFVEMTRNFDISEYDFALRETKTSEVIADVSSLKSEIGILYLSDFNRKILSKLFAASDIEFHSLIECKAYV